MNRAFLVGLISCRPVVLRSSGETAFLVLTPRDAGGERVDRHRVVLQRPQLTDLAELVPGATVYVEGYLARHGWRERVCVVAERAWTVSPPPPLPREAAAADSHASPREHLRAGHARRVGIGTPSERLVWVRPTTVRPTAATSRLKTIGPLQRVRAARFGSPPTSKVIDQPERRLEGCRLMFGREPTQVRAWSLPPAPPCSRAPQENLRSERQVLGDSFLVML